MKFQPLKIFIFLILLSVGISFVVTPKAPANQYYVGVTRPLVIAHQGGDGVWPGNTMYAFDKVVEIGADVLEMDAHITKDGEIVLMHDEAVDRTTDGAGLIEDLTLAEIQPPYNPSESLGIPIITERFLREAHAKHIRVEPWTVNDPELCGWHHYRKARSHGGNFG